MNRLIPDIPQMPAGEAAPMAAPSFTPGQKLHLRAQAKELGVSTAGTKAQIWQRIAAKQSENVGRRVRAPKAAPEAPAAQEAAPAIDPFDEALGRLEAFLRAR